MKVDLELFGVSRLIAGSKTLTLEVDEGTTFREIVRLLAERYPDMVGDVIQPDGETLQEPNIFNLNAEKMIQPDQMGGHPSAGDRVILMSISAGG